MYMYNTVYMYIWGYELECHGNIMGISIFKFGAMDEGEIEPPNDDECSIEPYIVLFRQKKTSLTKPIYPKCPKCHSRSSSMAPVWLKVFVDTFIIHIWM